MNLNIKYKYIYIQPVIEMKINDVFDMLDWSMKDIRATWFPHQLITEGIGFELSWAIHICHSARNKEWQKRKEKKRKEIQKAAFVNRRIDLQEHRIESDCYRIMVTQLLCLSPTNDCVSQCLCFPNKMLHRPSTDRDNKNENENENEETKPTAGGIHWEEKLTNRLSGSSHENSPSCRPPIPFHSLTLHCFTIQSL